MQVTISIGASRNSKFWNQTTMSWEDFCERLSKPIRSSETLAKFLSLNKNEQDELKDVGGFVGGTLSDGRRKGDHVTGRGLVTLDLDNIPSGQTESVLSKVDALNCAAVVYSTRKHQASAPRLRVVIPLVPSVSSDEYEPIARKLAEFIGMEYCDPTTFESSRLMYWPSCSSDGEYVFRVFKHDFASGLGILGLYGSSDAWKDVSNWPKVPGQEKLNKRRIDKQQDPLTKDGIVGAFCRAYSISEAIDKFLPNSYTLVSDGRYTYTGGSTVGGAVVYDNKFLYSHHASDPCCNQLVNAFDLIRIHKFGAEDDDAKDGTPSNRLPSFTAMAEFANADASTKAELATERKEKLLELTKTSVANNSKAAEIRDEDYEWTKDLTTDKKGNIENTGPNAELVVLNDPLLRNIAMDDFSRELCVTGPVAWDMDATLRRWTNSDDSRYRIYMEKVYQLKGQERLNDALTSAADQRAYNSVAAYLEGLTWDGEERIDTLLIDYLGADDNPYTRAVIRKTLCAAVARAVTKGKSVKYDYMPIIVGNQGIGKSEFISRLGKQWFNDSLTTFEGKEASEVIQGSWIIEVAELAAFNKSEVSTIKQFLTKKDDQYRPAYARRKERFPRRCVFFGTSNSTEFLRDDTGNRRFLPVDTDITKATKDIFKMDNDIVDQIWAEAVCKYRLGEKLHLDRDLEAMAVKAQEEHTEVLGNEGVILRYASLEVPVNWQKLSTWQRKNYVEHGTIDGKEYDGELIPIPYVCAKAVWEEALNGYAGGYNRSKALEINGVLKTLIGVDGWSWGDTRMGNYGIQKGLKRAEADSEN